MCTALISDLQAIPTKQTVIYKNWQLGKWLQLFLAGESLSPESTVNMAAKALSFKPSMTLPKWHTSNDMRMPPVASRRMYRHSATMQSHSTPVETRRRQRILQRKKHKCCGEMCGAQGWINHGTVIKWEARGWNVFLDKCEGRTEKRKRRWRCREIDDRPPYQMYQ